MSLCESIDTLSMAYLDDELAPEERRELELHLTECATCRGQLEAERAEQSLVQRALATPPASELLRAKIARSLDAEDAETARAGRKRWTRMLLPGSAIAAAAAAIAVFVGTQMPAANHSAAVVDQVMRQQSRPLPMEVQGPQTGQWLQQNANLEVPQVQAPTSQLLGARLLPGGVNGHDAGLVQWQIDLADGNGPFVLSMFEIQGVRDGEMSEGQEVEVNGRTLHVVEDDQGRAAVMFAGGNHVGYVFAARELSADQLVSLVGHIRIR
jgi:hypothetical protein